MSSTQAAPGQHEQLLVSPKKLTDFYEVIDRSFLIARRARKIGSLTHIATEVFMPPSQHRRRAGLYLSALQANIHAASRPACAKAYEICGYVR